MQVAAETHQCELELSLLVGQELLEPLLQRGEYGPQTVVACIVDIEKRIKDLGPKLAVVRQPMTIRIERQHNTVTDTDSLGTYLRDLRTGRHSSRFVCRHVCCTTFMYCLCKRQ